MDSAVFEMINKEIQEIIQTFHPNGYSQTLPGMLKAIHFVIESHKLTEDQWWGEVWRRGGHKDCMSYNAPRSSVRAPEPSTDVNI